MRKSTGAILRALLAFAMLTVFLQRCGTENPLAPDIRGENEIWIEATGFVPGELTVTQGTTVTWINKDTKPQIVRSVRIEINNGERVYLPSDGFQSSPNLRTGESYDVIFAVKGTYEFVNALLDFDGKIIVE